MKIEFPEYVLRILGAYENAGYEAYAVGGCVRDSLLGRTPHDWDIASSARPEETMRIMAPPDFSVKALSGLKHGTVTVVVKNGDENVFSDISRKVREKTGAEIKFIIENNGENAEEQNN